MDTIMKDYMASGSLRVCKEEKAAFRSMVFVGKHLINSVDVQLKNSAYLIRFHGNGN